MAFAQARYLPGKTVPAFAKTAVTGGRFVKVVDDLTDEGAYQVGHCAVAGEHAFGVAEADSAAATDPADSVERHINVIRRGAIARVKPGGAISRDTAVMTDASGQAVAWEAIDAPAEGEPITPNEILGYTMYTVAGTEALVDIELV
jgi:hypothetical protein